MISIFQLWETDSFKQNDSNSMQVLELTTLNIVEIATGMMIYEKLYSLYNESKFNAIRLEIQTKLFQAC